MTRTPWLRGAKSDEPDPPYVPVESPNTARSKSVFRVIDLLGHGPNGGLVNGAKSIYFDDVQLQADDGTWNFEGVTWAERTGLPDQSPLPGFPAVESTIMVGVNVTHDTPVTRTIINPDLDAVRVHLSMPALYQQFDNGDLKGATLQFMLEVVGHSSVVKTIRDKFMSTYEVDYRLSLPAGQAPWDIRVTRLTEDSTTTKLSNGLAWASYTEILDHRLIYPDSHIIGGSIDSSLFGGKIPKRSYDPYGRIIKVPANYNPQTREYTGLWDGTWQMAWTDNPAWCFYDMLEHDDYGLGIAAPDKWALYPIAQYCDVLVPDGFGGMEPRFTFNCVINTRHEAYSLINTMASVFSGMPLWSSGSVSAFQDAPADPQILATPANVVGGLFSYEGTGAKSRCTVAYVTWNDPANGGKPTIEPVVNRAAVRKYGYIEKDMVAFGCKSRGQAHRIGKWITDTVEAEKEMVAYRAGLDHAFVLPGMIVAVADPWVANVRMGGRLRDGFNADVLGDELAGSVGDWGTLTALRELSGTTAPNGVAGYLITDDSATVSERVAIDGVPYVAGQVVLWDTYIEQDAISDRVILLRVFGNGGTTSYFDVKLRTDTGDYNSQAVGGAVKGLVKVYNDAGWWRVRMAGTVDGSNTIVRCALYPAIGPDLASNSVITTGGAVIGHVGLYNVAGTDYTLLDPEKTILLDAPVTLADNETYTATVMLPDGTAEQKAVANLPGETSALSLASALSDVPAPNAVWVVTGTDIAPRLWRVLHKSEVDAATYQILAAEHDPTKYARIELGIHLDTPDYARPQSSGPVLPPNNPQLLLKAYYADGRLQNMLVFVWEAAADDRVNAYQVRYRVDDDQWTAMTPDSGFLAEKRDVQAGHHYFQVRSITRTGGSSLWAEADLEIGQATMPDVTGLRLVDGDTAITFTGGTAKFAWDPAALSDIAGPGGTDPWFKSYVIEVLKDAALVRTEYPVTPEYEYSFGKNTADGGAARAFTIRVYQLGNLGQLSTTPAVLTVSNPAPTMAWFTPTVAAVFKGVKISWASWSSSDTDLTSLRLYLDTSSNPTTLIQELSSEAIGYTETDLVVGTNYKVKIVPVDAFGAGTASNVANGTPVILAGVDVDIELSESIDMTDSDENLAATLAKLYDRNISTDGVSYTLAETTKFIDYGFAIVNYIDKVIIHTADANARVYFATTADGVTWSWFGAEADHTLTMAGDAVAAASQAEAETNYLQLAAGLNVVRLPQRVTACNCRLYMVGSFTTTIYELVFVREVIAEQVVADNLSAISANLGSIVSGYLQSEVYSASAGVKFDLDNGEFHLGGSGGGTTSPGFSYDPTNFGRFYGAITITEVTNPSTVRTALNVADGSTAGATWDGDINNQPTSLADINSAEWTKLDSGLETWVAASFVDATTYATAIADLQAQIDGAVETWFYEGTPGPTVLPESAWLSPDTRDTHLGDLYFDMTTGVGTAYRYFYIDGTGYVWQETDSATAAALALAQDAYDLADGKRRVFVVEPFTPYDAGDLWIKTASEIWRCSTGRATGAYTVSDWVIASTVGAPAGTFVNGVAAATVATAATNFNASNDRDSTAVVVPTIVATGAALDHTLQSNASADISFEWLWAGAEGDIDGFIVYTYQSAAATAYTFGTTPASETAYIVPANKRAFILFGVAPQLYYTFGVRAYRKVDPDINAAGLIQSVVVQPAAAGENPYQPSSTVAFAGNVTGTIDGTAASTLVSIANIKRRVFVVTPVTADAYDIGDLWDRGAVVGLWRCITAKAAGAAYSIAHWQVVADTTGENVALDSTSGGNYGFENGTIGLYGSPVGWTMDGNATVPGSNLCYLSKIDATTTQGHMSYGAIASSQLGYDVGWWAIGKRFSLSQTDGVVSVSCRVRITSATTIGWDGVYTEGEQTFVGEDDAYVKVTFYKITGEEIAIALAEQYSKTATHQWYIADGARGYYSVWTTLTHTVTAPAEAYRMHIELVATDGGNVTRALGYKRANAAIAFDDVVMAYTNGMVEAADSTWAAVAGADVTATSQFATDAASDNVLTPLEKPGIISRRDVIVAEQAGIDAQATAYGITTEKTTYDTAVTALTTYLATLTAPVLWSVLTDNTTVVGTTFWGKFNDVDVTRQALLNKINAAAKILADAAALTAVWSSVSGAGKPEDGADVTATHTANDTAYVAGTLAATVASSAAAAKTAVDNMSADGWLSAQEKTQWRVQWPGIASNFDAVMVQADTYGLSADAAVVALQTSRNTLYGYLSTTLLVWSAPTVATAISPDTQLRNYVDDYYACLAEVANVLTSYSPQVAVDAGIDTTTGGLTTRNASTGDYGHFTSGGLTFYFADGLGNYFPYKSVKHVQMGSAKNGVPFTVPGYWRTAPQIFPSMRGMPVYKAAYATVDQRMDFSVDTPTQVSTGVWQTKIYARLNTSAGIGYLTWANEFAHVDGVYGETVTDTEVTTTLATPTNVVSVAFSCTLNWVTELSGNPAQSATVHVYAYCDTVEYLVYSASVGYNDWYTSYPGPITKLLPLGRTLSVVAGTHNVSFKVVVSLYASSNWIGTYTEATLSNVKVTYNIAAGSILATGDVNYLAYSED